jgi:hypothetical protein
MYIDYCSFCGFALTTQQMAVLIRGEIIDYDNRIPGTVEMTLCQECWGIMCDNHNAGMDRAKERSTRLEKLQEREK